ncbi:MAG: HU family DNA-binding protein [Gammaproteobacteria bacterium]|nr:HU family DNA-binding protein [Gammaproteobacteria bacterium]
MTTSELIRQLAQQLNITQKEAHRLLHQELDAMARHLGEGKNVIIRGFGTLGLRDSRNIQSGRKNLFFRASQKLKDFVKPWKPEDPPS